MKIFFRKPFRWAAIYAIILTLSVTFVLLHTFIIPRTGTPAVTKTAQTETANKDNTSSGQTGEEESSADGAARSDSVITDTTYEDENIKITIETVRKYDTTFYMADIQVSGVEYLKTAFANGTYGRNIKETTSDIAKDNNAIFAINGDYYGFRDDGYVVRNGILYRDTSGGNQDLVIDEEGDFSIINESQTDAQTLIDSGAWQVLSFGPSLIDDGEIAVSADSEVDKSRTSNPRTAIGQVSELHYIIIVSDGRTDESAGLSLLQLAQELSDRGCTTAYNLDGGGSSTMWFNGQIINNPTDGRTDSERKVSDIVYFGY